MQKNINTSIFLTQMLLKRVEKKARIHKKINSVAIAALEEINKLLMVNAESSKEFDMVNISIRSIVKDALRTIEKIKK